MPPLNTFSRTCVAIAIAHATVANVHAATIIVDSNLDADGAGAPCTLREAIMSANTNPGNTTNGCVSGDAGEDTIIFSQAITNVSLTQAASLAVTEDLIITGPDATNVTINGMGNGRVFNMNNVTVNLTSLTITGGSVAEFVSGGGIHATASALTLNNSTVTGNTAWSSGGVYAYNSNINLNNSTVSANVAGTAGGIYARTATSLSLSNSQVSNNSATSASTGGGGISASGASIVYLTNTTVSNNSAVGDGAGIQIVSQSSLTITNNSSVSDNVSDDVGGGIRLSNGCNMSITDSTLLGNSAVLRGGAINASYGSSIGISNSTVSGNAAATGGGIFTFGALNLSKSTISNNRALNSGGAIYGHVASTLVLSNSTLSGNSATFTGAGVFANYRVSLTNSTVSNNTAGSSGGGLYIRGEEANGSVTLYNTVIAGNSAPTRAEIYQRFNNSAFTTSHNVLGDSSRTDTQAFNASFTPSATDITATSDGTQATALAAILAPLANNGGGLLTHALVQGSPAVGGADSTLCLAGSVNSEDQRGQSRTSVCDIGAFEAQTVVTVGNNQDDDSGNCSLRSAIITANTKAAEEDCAAIDAFDTEIVFDALQFPLDAENSITLNSTLPTITANLSITGQGASGLTVDGNDQGSVFQINNATVSLTSLTITGGSAAAGGGVFALSGSNVNLGNSTVAGNVANYGGGIHADESNVSLNNTTVSGNYGDFIGGGINAMQYSSVGLSNSTVSGNSTGSSGGGIYTKASSISLNNSTLSGNSAATSGGGIYASTTSSVNVQNSLLAGNLSSNGAEIVNFGASFATSYNVLGDSSHTAAVAFNAFMPSESDIIATRDGSNNVARSLSSILKPLANNGGPTQTHALADSSPAIDAADDTLCLASPISNLDQRGEVRPIGQACDIGSFEAAVSGQFFVVPLGNGKVVTFSL